MIKSPLLYFIVILSYSQISAQDSIEQLPSEKRSPETHLRGWIYGVDDSPVSLVLMEDKDKEPLLLAEASSGQISASEVYQSFKPGPRLLELRSGDKVLATSNIFLKDKEIYTLLAWKTGARWQVEMFSDKPSDENTVGAPLRIINFAENRETIISIDGGAGTKIPQSTVQELRGPRKTCMVRVQVLDPKGGHPAQSSIEVNFKSVPSTYVVVAPDYRGLMRPSIILGGKITEEFNLTGDAYEDIQR